MVVKRISNDELYHHGVKGQKWGVRRYQNKDGSLTPQGRLRYGNAQADYERADKTLKQVKKAAKPTLGTFAGVGAAQGAIQTGAMAAAGYAGASAIAKGAMVAGGIVGGALGGILLPSVALGTIAIGSKIAKKNAAKKLQEMKDMGVKIKKPKYTAEDMRRIYRDNLSKARRNSDGTITVTPEYAKLNDYMEDVRLSGNKEEYAALKREANKFLFSELPHTRENLKRANLM